MPAIAPSMAPCCSAGRTSPSVIATGVAPSRLHRFGLEVGSEDADLLAFEIGEMADRRFRDRANPAGAMNMPTPCSPLLAPSPSISFKHRRIGGEALAVLERVDQARRRHHLEALVDADEEFRRNDRGLDGAELHAFDLARDRAQLACRIDLALDAAARIPLDRGGKILGQTDAAPSLMVGVVTFIT